jgi:hypothetical protein
MGSLHAGNIYFVTVLYPRESTVKMDLSKVSEVSSNTRRPRGIYCVHEHIQCNRYEKVTCNALAASGFGIALSYGMENPGSITGSAGFFSFPQRPDQLLRPAQPLIQWVLGALSQGVKRPGRDAGNSPRLVQRSRKVELYLHSPICIHGIVLI